MMLKMTVDYNPSLDDNKVIRTGIINFNDSALDYPSSSFSIFLKDDEKNIHGGVIAWLDSDSIYIEILWVDEKLRGQKYGTKLLFTAKDEGRKTGCRFCTLDTFGFQAENFYVKNGYRQIGEIKNYIREYSRIFLRKSLI